MCALIRTGSIVSDLVGKVGGHVFQRSRGGLTLRSQPAPIERGLNIQNKKRNYAVRVQSAWTSLAISNRNLWEAYAVFKNKHTKKGFGAILTGQSIFMQENIMRLNINESGFAFTPLILLSPIITTPPQTISIVSAKLEFGNFQLHFDYNIPDATKYPIVFISRPLLPSQISDYNKKRFMALILSTGQVQDISAVYKAAWSKFPSGGNYVNTKVALYDTDLNTFSLFNNQRTLVT